MASRPPDDTMETAAVGWLAHLRITCRENAAYMECARRAGLDTHHWVRQVLNAAVAEALGEDLAAVTLEGDAE